MSANVGAPVQGEKGLIECIPLGVEADVYAYCEEIEVTAATGELLAGTASFKITNNDVDLKTPPG